jgi:hypothetical protein
MIKAFPSRRSLAGGIVAGLIGGCLLGACIVGMTGALGYDPGRGLANFFAFDAAALVGKAAYTSAAYVALGVVLHFLVAASWAVGYAYLAERMPQLVSRPVLSGAMFGLIVFFATEVVLIEASLFTAPKPAELLILLFGYLGCYGVPVAWIVARAQRAA